MVDFPIFLEFQERACLVVGGATVAARITQQLEIADAKVLS